MEVRPRARIEADVPLLRAGLERLAAAANLAMADMEGSEVTLRSPGQPAGRGSLDVTVTDDSVIIECRTVPDAEVWSRLHRLLQSAFAS